MFSRVFFLVALCIAACNMASAFRLAPAGVRRSCATSSAMRMSTVDDKAEVTEYFNNEGFNRWNKIYSESDEVNKVQMDIRTGHQQTIDKVLLWMQGENNKKKTVCDAGCGVGSLALPMSQMYNKVSASDISAAMTQEAGARAKAAGLRNLEFKVADMETLAGQYDTVTCIDVMIHYPTDKVRGGAVWCGEGKIR
jgi:magnesium-protoporphyrin O-methyltransferase